MNKETERFIKSIKNVRWFRPTKKPLKKWKHYNTYDNAVAAAVEASYGRAVWDESVDDIMDVIDVDSTNEVGDAAWAAADDAVCDISWHSTENAGRDADLMARILTSDLRNKKHIKHIKDRWQVWKMGYGLLCDMSGVLYTYKKC